VGRTAEATVTGIAVCQGIEGLFWGGQSIQAFFQDSFDGAIAGVVEVQGSLAGRLYTGRAILVLEPDDTLGPTQVGHDFVREQVLDQSVAGDAYVLGLFEAPLWVAHLVGQGFRRHMVVDGGAAAGLEQAGMGGHQLVIPVDPHRSRGSLEP